jgi:hypothetical protein
MLHELLRRTGRWRASAAGGGSAMSCILSATPENGDGCASQAEALLWHSDTYDNAVVKPI